MYQIKMTNGNEIQVTGNRCRLVNRQYQVLTTGSYEDVLAYAHARCITELDRAPAQHQADSAAIEAIEA